MSIYITQLIYIQKGSEDLFLQFEEIAMPAISKYNGTLLLRTRPSDKTIIETKGEPPYEIHLAKFPSETDFKNFMQDEERKHFLHLKAQSIQSVLLIKGQKL